MTAPSPNGCKRCGSVECPLPAANRRPGAWTRGSEAWVAALAAARDCESRPAVDWQAECRRLAAPAEEPLAEATTIVHPDAGDGPWVQPPRMAVPRAQAGERVRVEVRRG